MFGGNKAEPHVKSYSLRAVVRVIFSLSGNFNLEYTTLVLEHSTHSTTPLAVCTEHITVSAKGSCTTRLGLTWFGLSATDGRSESFPVVAFRPFLGLLFTFREGLSAAVVEVDLTSSSRTCPYNI